MLHNDATPIYRKGTLEEMQQIWPFAHNQTFRYFYNQIAYGNAEFWTAEVQKQPIGELYLFKCLPDATFADGYSKAYLCAFRIISTLRDRGYGSGLLQAVCQRARQLGFSALTIGVEENQPQNMRLYQRFGFTKLLQSCNVDPCDFDEIGQPLPCQFLLFEKKL